MTQAITVRQAGAEAVYAAIADGMKAAAYARELDAAHKANELLTAENDSLRADIRAKDREIARLRKQCRDYRFSRSRAYAQALEAQSVSVAGRRERGWAAVALMGIGGVIVCGIAIAIICLAGV